MNAGLQKRRMQRPGMNILRGPSNARMKGLDFLLKAMGEDFLGDRVVKTWPSSAEGAGLIPGQGAKISPAFWPKKPPKYTSNVVTNSIKTIKMAHLKKSLKIKIKATGVTEDL